MRGEKKGKDEDGISVSGKSERKSEIRINGNSCDTLLLDCRVK